MKLFKPADPTKRRPAWLQSHTKENLIWQLCMLPVVITAVYAWDWYDDRKLDRELAQRKDLPIK